MASITAWTWDAQVIGGSKVASVRRQDGAQYAARETSRTGGAELAERWWAQSDIASAAFPTTPGSPYGKLCHRRRVEMSAVRQWLEALALGQYAELFESNRIGIDILPDLTDQDLEKLGIPLGDRKRLLRAIVARGAAPEPIPAPAPRRLRGDRERRQVTIPFVVCPVTRA
jgi:hypothetical protein